MVGTCRKSENLIIKHISETDVNLSTSESLGAMLNILLKQIDKQINYKVTSDIAISHNLLVELFFCIWVI